MTFSISLLLWLFVVVLSYASMIISSYLLSENIDKNVHYYKKTIGIHIFIFYFQNFFFQIFFSFILNEEEEEEDFKHKMNSCVVNSQSVICRYFRE